MNHLSGAGSRCVKAVGLSVFLLLIVTPVLAQTDVKPRKSEVRVQANRTTRLIVIDGLDPAALARADRDRPSASCWSSLCPIIVRPDPERSSRTGEAILGTYRVEGSTLGFTARYPLDQPGYQALIDETLLISTDRRRLAAGQKTLRLAIDLDPEKPSRTDRAATVIAAVYPSAAVLPENLLRFYIHFSAPMSRGEAYRRIRLLDAAGMPVADPFLELDEELWSGDGCRFTLLFDPGRIKRGLKPREDVGPVLEEGRSYTLVIDRGWSDAGGRPLGGEYRRAFRVGPPDQTSPAPGNWAVRAPGAGTRDPLEIRFPEPLDSALARRLISVEDGESRMVPGQVRLDTNETHWLLTPEAPWKAGVYRIGIGTELEDLAGNAINRPFEVDQSGPITKQIESVRAMLTFEVRTLSR